MHLLALHTAQALPLFNHIRFSSTWSPGTMTQRCGVAHHDFPACLNAAAASTAARAGLSGNSLARRHCRSPAPDECAVFPACGLGAGCRRRPHGALLAGLMPRSSACFARPHGDQDRQFEGSRRGERI